MILKVYHHDEVQTGRGSSVVLDGEVESDLESRGVVHIDYSSGCHRVYFAPGWIGCAPVCLTGCYDYWFAPNLVLLRAAGSRRGGRCSKPMWHVCARWRARRAFKAAQMEEGSIMLPARKRRRFTARGSQRDSPRDSP